MKTQSFTVTLTFSNKITSDDDIKEITRNIADALKHSADTYGLAPESADGFTTVIEVTPEFLPKAKVRIPII